MAPHVQMMLSGALTFGAPLALALHELLALRRRPRGQWPDGPGPVPEPRSPTPLPDCLRVPERARHPRVREPA